MAIKRARFRSNRSSTLHPLWEGKTSRSYFWLAFRHKCEPKHNSFLQTNSCIPSPITCVRRASSIRSVPCMETDRPAATSAPQTGTLESSVPFGNINSLHLHQPLSPTRVLDERSCRVAGHIDQLGDSAAFPTRRHDVRVKTTSRGIHNHHHVVVIWMSSRLLHHLLSRRSSASPPSPSLRESK